MNKLISFTAILISFLVILSSCDGYNRVVKSDDYQVKFDEANKLYDAGKWERCVGLFEQVYQRSPKSPQGEVSYYRMGIACYKVEDWYLASYYLSTFQLKFPYSKLVEETMYLSALCAVHNSPEASLDQTETETALNELQGFINRFPNSEKVDTCNIVMNGLRFKLQTKDMLNVRLYSKTENFRAATVAAKAFIENYPISTYREEASAIYLRNMYKLTMNSIESKQDERITETQDAFLRFLAEFPESLYLREFESYPSKLEELKTTDKTNN